MSDSRVQKFSWIAEVEREEEEEKERQAAAAQTMVTCLGQGPSAFPTLGEAISSKTPKKEPGSYGYGYGKLEPAQAGGGRYAGPGRGSSGLTTNEILMLPTGPRDRSDEDYPPPGGLGGGFRGYGGNNRSGSGWDRNERDSERGFGSGFDNSSRADDSNNWGMNKAFRSPAPPPLSSRSREDNPNKDLTSSRADEVSSWSSLKKHATPTPEFRRQPDERSREGFDDTRFTARPPERRFGSGFVESLTRDSGSESERWSKRELPLPPLMRDDTLRKQAIVNKADEQHYTPPLTSQPKPKPNPFGSARPREEVLADRGLDPTEYPPVPLLPKERDSRPSSSHSSRSTTPEVKSEQASKPRPKVNPFGAARPREEVLQEKGKDWRKIDFDLEHRSVDRPETDAERILKEEINALNLLLKQEAAEGTALKKLNGANSSLPDNKGEGDSKVAGDAENKQNSLKDEILRKEKELWQLTWTLDDKVRFSQGGGERPGSRSSRGGESGRSVDSSVERPGSRSGLDSVVDRPGSQSGRESVERMNIGSSSSRTSVGGHEGRLIDTYERANSSSSGRRGDVTRDFNSSERSGLPYGLSVVVGRSNVHSERVGLLQSQGFAYPPQGRVADIWTRTGEESGNDERRSRGGRW